MFFLYKTINLINNKYYIGKHKGCPYDNYLGSGLLLKQAIQKYGRNNFRKEVILFCSNEVDLSYLEQIYVEKYIDDPNCYNISPGGKGGNTLKYFSNEKKREVYFKRKNGIAKWCEQNPIEVKRKQNKQRETLIKNIDKHKEAVKQGLRKRSHEEVIVQHKKVTEAKLSKGYYSVFRLYSPENILLYESIGAEDMAEKYGVTSNGIRLVANKKRPFTRGSLKGYRVEKVEN